MELTRRKAIVRMALILGATFAGPQLHADQIGRTTELLAAGFTPDELALLDEIGETIIPATPGAPGAKAIGIGAFIAMMVVDCYLPTEQVAFKTGLTRLAADYGARHGEPFIAGSHERRTAFLNALDREQKSHAAANRRRVRAATAEAELGDQNNPARPVQHFFRMAKELTLLGYFTSEFASTQLLGWVEVPGRYDGNTPYVKKTSAVAAPTGA